MSLKLIMNANGEIDHAAGSPVSGGSFVIATTPNLYTKAEGGGVYVGPLLFSFDGGDSVGMVDGSVALVIGSIPATATLAKASGSAVMRLGDSATITFTSVIESSGSPGTIIGDVEVSDAGQTSTKGQ